MSAKKRAAKHRSTSEIRRTELQIARVRLATQVVLLLIAVVGLVALFMRLQVGGDRPAQPDSPSFGLIEG